MQHRGWRSIEEEHLGWSIDFRARRVSQRMAKSALERIDALLSLKEGERGVLLRIANNGFNQERAAKRAAQRASKEAAAERPASGGKAAAAAAAPKAGATAAAPPPVAAEESPSCRAVTPAPRGPSGTGPAAQPAAAEAEQQQRPRPASPALAPQPRPAKGSTAFKAKARATEAGEALAKLPVEVKGLARQRAL